MVGVGEAALQYLDMGLSILPLRAGEKTPSTQRGFKDALSLKMEGVGEETVREFVRGYFSEVGHSDENIGIVTGILVDVLDVDVKDGKRGLESVKLLADAGLLDGFIGVAITPTGGIHYFYRTANRKTELLGDGLGLDYKSQGGYVVAAPSTVVRIELNSEGSYVPVREKYEWVTPLRDPRFGRALDWDECKRKLNVKPKVVSVLDKTYPEMGAGDTLTTMCSYIRSNPEDRNKKLFWAAIKCAEAGVDKAGFLELKQASLDMSLAGEPDREREIEATINSAVRLVMEASE